MADESRDDEATVERLVAELDAVLQRVDTDPTGLRRVLGSVLYYPGDLVDRSLAAAHPVTRATVAVVRGASRVEDAGPGLAAAATDADGRARARTALLAFGDQRVIAFVDLWRVDPARDPYLSDARMVWERVTMADKWPGVRWDPGVLASMDDVPEPLRALFPIEELPAYQRYLSLVGTFEFPENELDMIELIQSAGLETITFLGDDPQPVCDVAAQVALERWPVWEAERSIALENGDWDACAELDAHLVQARRVFARSVATGADIGIVLAAEDPDLYPNLYGTLQEVLEVVLALGSNEQRAQLVREMKVLLSGPQSPELSETARASYAALRAQVDLYSKMDVPRGPAAPDGPGALGI